MTLQLVLRILLVVIFVGLLTWMWVKGYKIKVLQIIQDFVMKVEEDLGSGTGEIKKIKVLSLIYQALPSLITFIIGETKLLIYIQIAVEYIKTTKLSSGETIEEYLSFLAMKKLGLKKTK